MGPARRSHSKDPITRSYPPNQVIPTGATRSGGTCSFTPIHPPQKGVPHVSTLRHGKTDLSNHPRSAAPTRRPDEGATRSDPPRAKHLSSPATKQNLQPTHSKPPKLSLKCPIISIRVATLKVRDHGSGPSHNPNRQRTLPLTPITRGL
jgi:hypothetical protein